MHIFGRKIFEIDDYGIYLSELVVEIHFIKKPFLQLT